MANPLSRRRFLQGLGLTAAGALLSACQSGAVATPTTAAQATRPAGGTTPAAATTPAAGNTPAAGGTTPATGAGTPTAGAAVAGSTPTAGAQTATGGYLTNTRVTGAITFWHFWGSPLRRNAVRRIVNSFQQQYPGVKVTETFFPFGEIWTKNNAAVAAGSGMPDVLVEDRPQLPDRAAKNIATNLGDLAKRDNVTGAPFWKFTWEETLSNGQPYGLPYETDIRVLFYNKAILKDAGFDPEKPPQNWDEIEQMAAKIDKKAADGRLERVAFWPMFGNIGLDQWTWNNGGDWMDKDKNFTITRKENVETLEWMKKWVDRYGLTNWNAFAGTFGPQGPTDGFMAQKVAMKVDIAGYTSFLNQTNPNFSTTATPPERLGWGVAKIPPAPGKQPASLSGGFALAIPRGAKGIDAAWEFAKYAVFVGQASWARDTYSIPTIEALAKNDPNLTGDPNWQFFIEAMSYGRPALYNPNYTNWSSELGPAQDKVWRGEASPQQALEEAQRKIEAEVAKNKR